MMNSVSWVDEKVADSPRPALVKRRRSGKQRAAPPGPAAEKKESVYEFDVEEAREAPKKKKKKHKAEPKVKIVKAKENLDVVNKPKPKVRKSPRTPVHDDDDDNEEEEDTPALRVRRKGTTPKGMVFKVLGTQ
jgi:hypothetical protein